jgi:hypothetical protein
MKDANLKLEFEEKLKKIIIRVRKTDINKNTMQIFSAILGSLFKKYFNRRESGEIRKEIDEFFFSENPEKFNLLIDMIEEVYL